MYVNSFWNVHLVFRSPFSKNKIYITKQKFRQGLLYKNKTIDRSIRNLYIFCVKVYAVDCREKWSLFMTTIWNEWEGKCVISCAPVDSPSPTTQPKTELLGLHGANRCRRAASYVEWTDKKKKIRRRLEINRKEMRFLITLPLTFLIMRLQSASSLKSRDWNLWDTINGILNGCHVLVCVLGCRGMLSPQITPKQEN
jgi:hypothetical protein